MSAAPVGGGRFHWTGRAYLLLGSAVLLALLAVALRSPVPLLVAVPLLFAPFIAASVAPPASLRADLTWEARGLGASVEVEGTLRGEFGSATSDLEIDLYPPAGARLVRRAELIRGPTAVEFATAWAFREPTITHAEPPRVVWRDPLGLGERELGGLRPPLPLERYPAELHRLGAIRLARTIALPGETRSPRLGPDGEFFGLRDAAPDEPRRRINWRASARAGRLVVNDYLLDRTGDVLLLLDSRPTSRGPAVDGRLLAVARAGAYGIADALLRTKARVGFASFGEFLSAVPLASGRGHRVRLLQAVLASGLAEVAGPAARCAHSLRRYYRPGVTTLLVSGWTDDPGEDLAPYLRYGGYPPCLIAPSPLPMVQGRGGFAPDDEALIARLERAERRVRLAEVWPYAPVVDWEDYWSFEGLVRLLRQPAHRRVA